MHLLKMVGVTLGLLPALALVPGVPKVELTGYEAKLHMQMWSNFEVENEQETVTEMVEGVVPVTEGTTVNDTEDIIDTTSTTCTEEIPTAGEVVDQIPEPVVESTFQAQTTPLYSVEGQLLDPAIQEYLYTRLCNSGIGWFMPYAILIAYQESSFNIYAVNQENGIDKGLFQFRSTYWGAGDIFNPYTQIDVFVGLMANRANNLGCTVSDMISRHNVSDYCPYNQAYVDAVMSHSGSLVKVR